MIKSMTGYGRGEANTERMRFVVEMKSVNHRYSEVMVRMPREWLFVEDMIKKTVQARLKRGRMDVFVTVFHEQLPSKQLQIDWSLAEAYINATKELNLRFGVTTEVSSRELLQFPDLVQLKEEEADLQAEVPALLQAAQDAVERLLLMRMEEGKALRVDITERLAYLEREAEAISQRAPIVVQEAREKLVQKLEDWLPESNELDQGRLLTEIALMAERGDISEETTRLTSHIRQFASILETDDPVGRQLDFLVQEMNREVNTIGSKANDLQIAQKVVTLKSELEKIREQVQNIE